MSSKLFLIRGARIENQINLIMESSTYRTLRQNLRFLTTKKRQLATDPVIIKQSEITPAAESKIITINTIAASGGKSYNTSVQFDGIGFEDADTPNNITFVGSDGEDYYMKSIELKRKNVKVSCNCLDFYHRFAAHNDRDNSLHGNPPPPYTPTSDRKSDNPKKVPGVCKHIIKTIDSLKKSGMVR